MKYDSKFIVGELRRLADSVEKYNDGLEWGNLVRLVATAEADLASKQEKIIREENNVKP